MSDNDIVAKIKNATKATEDKLKKLDDLNKKIYKELVADAETFVGNLYHIIEPKARLLGTPVYVVQSGYGLNDNLDICCLFSSSGDSGNIQDFCNGIKAEQLSGSLFKLIKGETQDQFRAKVFPIGLPTIKHDRTIDWSNDFEYLQKHLTCLTASEKYGKDSKYTWHFIRLDEFTNEYLIRAALANIYAAPHISTDKLIGASICTRNSRGVIITVNVQIGNILEFASSNLYYKFKRPIQIAGTQEKVNTVDEQVIFNIIKQVIEFIVTMQAYEFIHGNLIAENILLDDINYNYQNLKVKLSNTNLKIYKYFSVKITNFSKSSISLRSKDNEFIRLHNLEPRSKLSELWGLYKFQPKVNPSTNTYRLSDNTEKILNQVRHIGLPFYKSFDVYTFLVSLMLIPQFSYVMTHPQSDMREIMKLMWGDAQLNHVLKVIYGAVNEKPNNYETVVDILKKFDLKCDLVEKLVELLKNRGYD